MTSDSGVYVPALGSPSLGGGACGGASYGLLLDKRGALTVPWATANIFESGGQAAAGGQGGTTLSGKAGTNGAAGPAGSTSIPR